MTIGPNFCLDLKARTSKKKNEASKLWIWDLGDLVFFFFFFKYQTSTINHQTTIKPSFQKSQRCSPKWRSASSSLHAEKHGRHFKEPATYCSYKADSTSKDQSHWNPFVGRSHPWSLRSLWQLLALYHFGKQSCCSALPRYNHREHSKSLIFGRRRC